MFETLNQVPLSLVRNGDLRSIHQSNSEADRIPVPIDAEPWYLLRLRGTLSNPKLPPPAGCRQEAVKTVPSAVPSGPAEPLLQLVDPADVARAGHLPVGSKHLPQNCRQ